MNRHPTLWPFLPIVLLAAMIFTPVMPIPGVAMTALASPVPASPLSDTSPFGINGALGIRYTDDAERSQALQLMQDAGVRWQREEFIWDVMENPKGTFHWYRTDSAVTSQRDAGINLLGLIDYGAPWWGEQGEPFWDKDVPSPPTPEMIAEWRFYVGEVVRRYKDSIRHWEIWNEENIEGFWKPLPNPDDYAQLLRAAYEEIKQEDPQAIVLLGGTSGVDVDFIDQVIAANGGNHYFDVVNVHPYIWDKHDPGSSPERRGLRDYVAPATRFGKPVWLTEIGWSTAPDGQITETLQARYLMRTYLISLATPGIEKIFWYNFRNSETDNIDENHYGIVRRDFTEKEAYYAYQAMARALNGAQFTKALREGQEIGGQVTGDGIYEYWFSKGNEAVVALWRAEGGDASRPTVVQNITASSVSLRHPGAGMAAPWTVDTLAVTNDQVTVDVSETPVFLTFQEEQLIPGAAGTATVFLLDVSGSMDDPWQGGIKIESAKSAALNVLDMIEQDSLAGGVSHQVAIATFSSDARLDLPLTTDYGQARQIIQSLNPLSRTNMGAGLEEANIALQGMTSAQKIIILLSDGLTNEGMSSDQILSGPVQEAAQAGTCIYTVGFGEPGELDEDLLRQIAQAACGQYTYADTPYDLETVYVQVRHQSLGTVIDQFQGQVTQGETTAPHSVQVPDNQGELHVTINWEGSQLDMVLLDPEGQQVSPGDPGVIFETYARMVYAIITDPLPGIWQLAVHGTEVPEGILDFSAIASVRPLPFVPPPIDTNRSLDDATLLLIVLVLGIGAIALILYTQLRSSAVPRAGVRVAADAGQWAGLRRGVLRIGRDPRCDLVLPDSKVSRYHAQLLETPHGYLIEDLRSTNGTWVNGQRISQEYLHPNDQIRVGDTGLIFWQQER